MINLGKLSIEDFLFARYQECYDAAKFSGNPEAMLFATDRQAALLGVTFDYDDNGEEEEDEV